MSNAILTQDTLRAFTDYDPATGVFTRKVTVYRTKAGHRSKPGHPDRYTYFRFWDKNYLAHRIAWLWVYGQLPEQPIDHINGRKNDDRIANLRLATPVTNGQNLKMLGRNTSGVQGVSWDSRRNQWLVTIVVNRVSKYVGRYATLEQARHASISAKAAHHPFATFRDAVTSCIV